MYMHIMCSTVRLSSLRYFSEEGTSCTEGEVRLEGGFDSSNGRVEYCQYRTWGTVCNEGWDDNDARVACSQLGYNPDGMLIRYN